MNRNTISFALSAFLVACNVNESSRTAPDGTVSIAPRIATAQGVSLPVTDSVYIKVSSSDPSKIWYEKSLPWSAKFVVISGLPKGVAFTVVMEGREAQGNGTSSTWWSGTQSGTAGAEQTVAAQELTVPVSVLYSPAPWNASVTYGALLDVRDGQTYRTVQIGGRRWMAENLNFKPAGADSGWCYDNSGANCAKYGRLYSWFQTMAGAASSAAVPSGVRGVCPEGWHIPSDGEWTALTSTVAAAAGVGTSNAGTALKSISGWDPATGNGTDAFGFRFLPAGFRGVPGGFVQIGTDGYSFSATAASSTMASAGSMNSVSKQSLQGPTSKENGLSVRCVENFQASNPVDSGAFKQDANTLGLWRFDEGAGASVVNQVTGKAGSLTGGVSWVSGKFGKAIQFDGATGYGNLAFDPPERDVTYEWVGLPESNGVMVDLYGGFNTQVKLDSTKVYLVRYGEVGATGVIGVWAYFALTIGADGTGILYRNGVEVLRGKNAESQSWGAIHIGASRYTTMENFLKGRVDEFRVSSGVRTATEIQQTSVRLGLVQPHVSVPNDSIPWNDSVSYGALRDARDGQAYRTVTIGGREWMAENLNHKSEGADSGWCYDNLSSNCTLFGRLYTWSQTMQGAGSSSAIPSGVRGICPEGWHVPSDGEWAALTNTVAARPGVGVSNVGTVLKSSSGWLPTTGNGTDAVGFRFLPAGTRGGDGSFNAASGSGTIAASTDVSANMALNRATMPHWTAIYNNRNGEAKSLGLSVRCVKDYPPDTASPTVPVAGTPSGGVGMRGLARQVNFPNSCAFLPANSPFTIEFWVRERGTEATAGFTSYQELGETRGLGYTNRTTGDVRFRRLQGSGWWAFHPDLNLLRAGDGDTLKNGEWGHAAFVYTGSEGILFLNGAQRARVSDSRSMACGSSVALILEADSAEIDNVRISKVARYTGTFTPPTSYVNDSVTAYRWTFDGPVADRLKDDIHGVVLVPDAGRGVTWIER